MKLLVVSNTFPSPRKPYGGTFVKEQVAALRALGTDVDVIGDTGEGKSPRDILCKYLRLFAKTVRAVFRTRYDAIHAHYIFPTGTIALLAATLRRTPVIVTSHRGDIYHMPQRARVLRFLTGWTLRRAAAIVAVSEELKADIISGYDIPPEKVRAIHMGVNTDKFTPGKKAAAREKVGLSTDGPQALMVALKFERKGGLVLLDALSRIRDTLPPGLLVHVVGTPPEARWTEAAAEHGVADLLRFHGSMSHDAVASWIMGCDLFLLPSYSEGLPISLLEAMASGRAVIATPVGGVPEVVHHGENGLLVEPGDAAQLADALSRMLADANLRDSMGAAARTTVEAHSTRESAAAVLRILDGIL
ncbi:MAG: glycosyltransferase [Gemmatimonadota bacterium]|jgi:glycosyltransferase involved in cell wall biosynthesis|nr:glycosyltransferase [Gemmatimonadota bacterium]MDP6802657.1 glycosyltransferase [Gemmatimonadota bacterium]